MPSGDYDEEEFGDFLSKIEDVNKMVQGLKDGTVDPNELDVLKKEDKLKAEYAAADAKREAKKAKEKADAEAKQAERAAEVKRRAEYKEQNKEKLEELKQAYYFRKARRERWEEFRAQNKSRAFSDYYKGWSLFEEDPDEELFTDADAPAAVQDQSAFDAMAKDIEQRTKERKGMQAAGDKERERGNLAFKAMQYTEALAAYSRAIEHFKGDKVPCPPHFPWCHVACPPPHPTALGATCHRSRTPTARPRTSSYATSSRHSTTAAACSTSRSSSTPTLRSARLPRPSSKPMCAARRPISSWVGMRRRRRIWTVSNLPTSPRTSPRRSPAHLPERGPHSIPSHAPNSPCRDGPPLSPLPPYASCHALTPSPLSPSSCSAALDMAPDSEKAEIKRQMRALKDETAAAKAEAMALDDAEKAAATGDPTSTPGGGAKASRERVRELLDLVSALPSTLPLAPRGMPSSPHFPWRHVACPPHHTSLGATWQVRTASSDSIAELGSVLEAANGIQDADKMDGADAASARARAANAAMKRGQLEEKATKALDELTNLAQSSAACRIVLRQVLALPQALTISRLFSPSPAFSHLCAPSFANLPPPLLRSLPCLSPCRLLRSLQAGGIPTLLALLDSSKSKAVTAAADPPAGSIAKEGKAITAEAYGAARALWKVHVGKLLVFACTERKNQHEVHACGGTSQLLRELRKAVPLESPDAPAAAKEAKGGKGSQADAVLAATYAALAPQLRLLALCCVHETVAVEVRRLSSGEGTLERLLALLGPPDKAATVSPSQVCDLTPSHATLPQSPTFSHIRRLTRSSPTSPNIR